MSLHSDDTQDTAPTATSIAPLQDLRNVDNKSEYRPLSVDDPKSFELVATGVHKEENSYSIENRAELMFSKAHLQGIFSDARLFLKFTTYLSNYRPHSVPLLIYYLDTQKALRAIAYSNAIAEGLESVKFADFTSEAPRSLINVSLQDKSDRAFSILAQEDLPAYVTHTFVQVVSVSIHRKITGVLAPHLQEASEGLAEVFCMSDVSKPDCPIVFSSEEFFRTTQYGLNYAVGRNCRFLQGPRSSPFSVQRLREAIRNGREHQEVLLNYRRDGSSFMNLLTMAPLMDNQGNVRYYIGAQVDVSGLVKDCTNLEALQKIVESGDESGDVRPVQEQKDEFQALSEMFNHSELETIRQYGGRMHSEQHEVSETASAVASNRPRLLIREPSDVDEFGVSENRGDFIPPTPSPSPPPMVSGKLPGIFAHYLILRPHPSLRITFTSPTLRVPGLLQSPFLSRVGGSGRVRQELALALSEGRNVTAKIRWLNERYDETIDERMGGYGMPPSNAAGKPRWIHCTPLLGQYRNIGSWMVIMIDGDEHEHARIQKAEKVGITSVGKGSLHQTTESYSSGQVNNGNTSRAASRASAQHNQHGFNERPVMSTSSLDSEWDADLDVASNAFHHPSRQSSGRTQADQTQRGRAAVLGPPPRSSLPAVPVPGASRTTSISAGNSDATVNLHTRGRGRSSRDEGSRIEDNNNPTFLQAMNSTQPDPARSNINLSSACASDANTAGIYGSRKASASTTQLPQQSQSAHLTRASSIHQPQAHNHSSFAQSHFMNNTQPPRHILSTTNLRNNTSATARGSGSGSGSGSGYGAGAGSSSNANGISMKNRVLNGLRFGHTADRGERRESETERLRAAEAALGLDQRGKARKGSARS